MLQGKKADIRIIALSILIIIAAVILIVPATGEDVITGDIVAEGFSAEGEIGISNTHISTATISPSPVAKDTSYTFTVHVENLIGWPHSIHEFRIYQHSEFEVVDQQWCKPAEKWLGPYYAENTIGKFCFWTATAGYEIDPGESKDFTFEAETPSTDCCRPWLLETRDPQGYYVFIEAKKSWHENETLSENSNTNICIDAKAPILNKLFSPEGTYVIRTINNSIVEWIDTATYITLENYDPEPHPSGIAGVWWKNKLVEEVPSLVLEDHNDSHGCSYDDFCLDNSKCQSLLHLGDEEQTGEWLNYTNPFQKEGECCHVLWYKAVDKVGNEVKKVNCFFVDKTAPIPEKTVGEPNIPCEGKDLILILENKNSDTWQIIPGDNIQATLQYNSIGSTFKGILTTTGLEAQTEYSLIYYADRDPRFQLWGGDNPGAIIATFTGDVTNLAIDKDLGMNLPASPDWNIAPSPDYCDYHNTYDNYTHCSGAKIWIVKTSDLTEGNKLPVINWGNHANWLFETDLINYTDGERECDYWVRDHVTPITLNCTDPQPHPSGDEEVCYKVSFGDGYLTNNYCELFGGTMEEGWCCDDVSEKSYTLVFQEDSLHDLEYFCRDAVNKTSEIDKEWFIVDSQPPIITKEMIGTEHLGNCPPTKEGDKCFVADDGENGVRIDVKDDDKYGHAVDNVQCSYELWWEGQKIDSGSFGEEGKNIIFKEDSTHTLKINCSDALGNSVYDEEEFLVDSKPPVTTKTFGEPYKADPECVVRCRGNEECIHATCPQWITGGTPITLTADDEKVGVDKIYWADKLLENDNACWNPQEYCKPVEIQMNEVLDDEVTFYKRDEESCHLIEYYAVDKLGNTEDIKWQCVFVDNSAPESYKEHGTPLIEDEGFDWVTQQTQITLGCEDQGDHPVKQETLCYKVSLDDYLLNGIESQNGQNWLIYLTENYCNKFGGEMEEGWCCEYIDGEDYSLNFMEETYHNLEYYCKDHLGNTEEPKIQYYKVDNTAPETTKDIEPDPYTKEIEGQTVEWIDTANEIILKARDDVGPHDSGVDKIWYMNIIDITEQSCWVEEACQPVTQLVPWQREWSSPVEELDCIDIGQELCRESFDKYDSWEDCVEDYAHKECNVDPLWKLYKGPFNKLEESCHILTYFAVDNLGNIEKPQANCFFVDKEPPVTTKTYEGPQYPEEGYPKWITNETEIILEAEDTPPHPSGIKEIRYKISGPINDTYCDGINEDKRDSLDCDDAPSVITDSFFDVFIELSNVKIPQDSCHLIEYYSIDNVDKKENTKRQCVFVDSQPPTPNKTVGEPKTEWDGKDSIFYKNETKNCWTNVSGSIECWKVTLDTPISMTCTDPQPHPVDNEKICFNVGLDGDDATGGDLGYCNEYEGIMNGEYCCLKQTIEDFIFLESSEHNLKFYCEDALGNKGPVDEEKFKVEGNDFEIELNKKWNLISVPVVLLNNDPEEVFKNVDVENCIQSVWTYDGKTDNWTIWTPGDAPDDLKVKPGFGYWIIANEDCMLTIGGSLLSPGRTPPSRKLVPGWNLIGYYGMDEQEGYYGPYENGRDAYCALYSLTSGELGMPKWSSLYGYWETDEPQFEDYSMFGPLDPGAGYWINLKDNQQEYIYSPSTICYDWWGGWF